MNRTDGKTRPDACWRIIGISGDRSCPDLPKYTHCRNCPVFASGGRHLMDRPVPEDYRRFWTGLLSKSRDDAQDRHGRGNGFLFRIADQWLALPTSFVKDATPLLPIRRIPHRSNRQLLGLVNIHGVLRLCASIHSILDSDLAPPTPESENARKARMVVVEKNADNWVFPVDEIFGLHFYSTDHVQNSPVTATKVGLPLTVGMIPWDLGVAGLLDEQELLAAFNRSLR